MSGNHNIEEAMQFAEKLRKAFETHLFQVSEIDEALTVSFWRRKLA